MDHLPCWCYLCSQRVTTVVEADAGIKCPHCQDIFVEQTGGGRMSLDGYQMGSRDWFLFWSPTLLGLVGDFDTMDDGFKRDPEGMLFGMVDFWPDGDRDSGTESNVTAFAQTLADYLLEGEKGARRDRPRRLKPNTVRVSESGLQCCICLEDFERGEEVEKMPCEHGFHRHCIGSWFKKGNGTCPMCRFQIPDAGEGNAERFSFAYRRDLSGLRNGVGRMRSRIRQIRNYLRR